MLTIYGPSFTVFYVDLIIIFFLKTRNCKYSVARLGNRFPLLELVFAVFVYLVSPELKLYNLYFFLTCGYWMIFSLVANSCLEWGLFKLISPSRLCIQALHFRTCIQHSIDNSDLVFLMFVHNFRVSQSWKIGSFSGFSWACTYIHMYVHTQTYMHICLEVVLPLLYLEQFEKNTY